MLSGCEQDRDPSQSRPAGRNLRPHDGRHVQPGGGGGATGEAGRVRYQHARSRPQHSPHLRCRPGLLSGRVELSHWSRSLQILCCDWSRSLQILCCDWAFCVCCYGTIKAAHAQKERLKAPSRGIFLTLRSVTGLDWTGLDWTPLSPQVLVSLLWAGADPAAANSSGKTSLGLAADHASMEDFMEISSNLVAAGATGTEQDWEVLTKHPR